MKLIKSLVKFLQEFVDARKRSVQTAPQVLYSHIEPPLDIQSVTTATTTTNTTNKKDNYGYVTFVLFPRHLVLNKRENCILILNYLEVISIIISNAQKLICIQE